MIYCSNDLLPSLICKRAIYDAGLPEAGQREQNRLCRSVGTPASTAMSALVIVFKNLAPMPGCSSLRSYRLGSLIFFSLRAGRPTLKLFYEGAAVGVLWVPVRRTNLETIQARARVVRLLPNGVSTSRHPQGSTSTARTKPS